MAENCPFSNHEFAKEGVQVKNGKKVYYTFVAFIAVILFVLLAVHISTLKIQWNGISSTENGVFATTTLPENAVQFKEADTQEELLVQSYIFVVPITLVCIAVFLYFRKKKGLAIKKTGLLFGGICGLLATIPHELLHAISFPAGAEVSFGIIASSFSAYASSTAPMMKWQFIVMSLLPFFVLGVIPIVIFFFVIRKNSFWGSFLWAFAIFGLIGGTPDILNVINVLMQMPNGAIIQTSGFHSYWYFPQ